MSHHSEHPTPTRDQTLVAGHELTDADGGPILKFLIFLMVSTIVVAGLLVPFYNFLEGREAVEKTVRYPLAAGRPRPLPPTPRLQTYPFTDLKDLHAEENQVLDTYGWVDKSAGVVRLPIERAIELTAERGLPSRAPGEAGAGAQAPEGTAAQPASSGTAGEPAAPGATAPAKSAGAAPAAAGTPKQ